VPIVFVEVTDPVAFGLVASLARPGGKATGFTGFDHSFSAKWVLSAAQKRRRSEVSAPLNWQNWQPDAVGRHDLNLETDVSSTARPAVAQ
jgi:hypothetical protein